MFFILAGFSTLSHEEKREFARRAREHFFSLAGHSIEIAGPLTIRRDFERETFIYKEEPADPALPDDWLPAEVSSSRDFALLELRQGPVRRVPPQARPPPRLFNLYV